MASTPEEELWITVTRNALRELEAEHAWISKQVPLIRDLLAGRVPQGDTGPWRTVSSLHRHLEEWRELRRWFIDPRGSFEGVCLMLNLEPGAARRRVNEYLHLEFNALALNGAIEKFKRARKGSRKRARERRKAEVGLGGQGGKTVPRVPGQDAVGAWRADSLRRAKAARAEAEARAEAGKEVVEGAGVPSDYAGYPAGSEGLF
ncbi:MAG: hypothetical protein V3T08_10020 [Gemmatimonadota bacterium]